MSSRIAVCFQRKRSAEGEIRSWESHKSSRFFSSLLIPFDSFFALHSFGRSAHAPSPTTLLAPANMLLLRISLAFLFAGACVAALDGSTTHYPTVMGHQPRRGLAARHTVAELREARESLSPEAQSFFGQSRSHLTPSSSLRLSILEQRATKLTPCLPESQIKLSPGLLECERV